MAQQVFAAKSDVLGLIPGTHIVEEENQSPKVVLWHACCDMCVTAPPSTVNIKTLDRPLMKCVKLSKRLAKTHWRVS